MRRRLRKTGLRCIGLLMLFLLFSIPTISAQANPVRLVSEDYDVWSCDWGGNGRIVFSGKAEGENGNQMRIWLYRPGEGKKDPTLWTGTGSLIDLSPRWAPDGSGVVMIRRRVSSITAQGLPSSVWWKAFPSGEGLRLTGGPWDSDPAWAPNGKEIVFVRGEGPNHTSLAIVGKNGGKIKTIVPGRAGVISAPSWGRNDRIYFTRIPQETGRGGIYYVDLKTGEEKALLEDEHDHRFPSVSPNGKYLAYVSTRGMESKEDRLVRDRGALYIYDLKTGKSHLVTTGVSMHGAPPAWSPDGKRLVFFSLRSKRPAMWVVNWKRN